MAMDFGGGGGAGAAPGAGCGHLAGIIPTPMESCPGTAGEAIALALGGLVDNAPIAAAKAHSCVGLRNHVKHTTIPWAS